MPDVNFNQLRENTFYFTLLAYVASLPYAEAFVSIAAGILLVQAIILTSWKHPSVKPKEYKSLLMVVSIFIVYLLGMFGTSDFSFALYELRKVAFWVILPIAFFISPRIDIERFHTVLIVFCLSVFSASVVVVVRLLFKDYLQIADFRDITIISHIRYSFQVVLSIIIVAYFLISGSSLFNLRFFTEILYTYIIWMIIFLFIIKSITGIIAFAGTALLLIFLILFKMKNRKMKSVVLVLMLLFIISPVLYVYNIWKDFYNIEKLDPQKVEKYTIAGNPYSFDFTSFEKENGHWVKAYICETELRKEWNKRSRMKYDSLDVNGYSYGSTLIRYLTSKGYRKDSLGVTRLSEEDVKAIENGIANYIFIHNRFSIYPRIYETIWELDRYIHAGDPNFQSLSQRIEFIKASFILIKSNPLVGIGTGNWKIKYAEAYKKMNSKLIKENQGPSHNQYLNYLVKFGVLGFVYIFSMLLLPVFREKHKRNLVFWLFLVSISIANFADANFETHMGLSFFCFFYCFFLWHSPQEFKSFHL